MIQDLHVISGVLKAPLSCPMKNNASSINTSSTILSNLHKVVLIRTWAVRRPCVFCHKALKRVDGTHGNSKAILSADRNNVVFPVRLLGGGEPDFRTNWICAFYFWILKKKKKDMLQLDAILQLCSTLLSIRQAALPHIIDISSSWITDSAVWKCIRTA